jgi:AcrR family transcriptional regulator
MLANAKRDRVGERRSATRREILDSAWAIARENGLAQVTLRDVADRVGMRAPSLYRHFESKNAIYDAMFADSWSACLDVMTAVSRSPSTSARATIKRYARTFFDFAVADLARYQLMNQRTIVGFEPSAGSYAIAVATLDAVRAGLATCGVTGPEDVDLYVALAGGLIDAQLANDPGGDRWSRLLDRTYDMLADNLGIPTP